MISSPKPPNPYDQASAQQKAEQSAAQTSSIMNNPNQVNPYGSSNYSLAGYETVYDAKGKPQQVPRYTQTVTLSPEQQQLLNYQNQMGANIGQAGVEQSARLRELLAKQITTQGMQGWQAAPQAGEVRQDQGATDRTAIEQAMMARYKEQAGKQAQSDDAMLAARGMNPGSAQYGSVADTRARSLTDATQQAYLASGAEARAAQEAFNMATGQRYEMDMGEAQFNNQLRQSQLEEMFALRNQPINETTALMGGSQVTMPQFNPFSAQGVNSAPIGSYIGQNYQQRAQNASAATSGLFQLGGTVLGGMLGGPVGAAAGAGLGGWLGKK